MLLVSSTRSSTSHRLIRGVALLILSHAAMDLAFPDLCRGETLENDCQGLIAAATRERSRVASSSVAHLEASDKPRTNDPSEQPSGGDECFCCCSHVLPGTVIAAISVTDLRSPVTRLEYLSAASPPLARAFRPPRFV